ncbi:hypothetical protein HETIRDRAFT_450516 [Heterobasidion irregulare TC 32-1]|uniref:SMP-30/Gluconolactonase/LRE-like region domain-containing protein n=1 Tax=Heterobasidion irregulare (strain TC 32-1) TaxID=747525 RepID=W4KAD2_HETIT|nr:uncharacterized protein HETIRDRAFT_450516 [Heterobasidion irregulare TC 32-1]ETW82753.1 hypothetical protein HETIRDRAFT_450516 [Heterobasidion irregulare TC 32-1]
MGHVSGRDIFEARAAVKNPFAPFQVFGNATIGPELTVEHLFFDQWPTGLSVSSTGKIYANFPTAVNQTNTKFTVGVVNGHTSEAAFPSVEANQPPAGFLSTTDPVHFGSNDSDHLISVQSVVVDALDRVWALDTGRPLVNGQMVLGSQGGPKLVGFDQNGTKVANLVLPAGVAFPDSYLNDVRFDLRASTLPAGKGVAYVTDSSNEGRNGIIVIDLGTGNAWRHLDSIALTRADSDFKSSYNGRPFQVVTQGPTPGIFSRFTTGSDGIALSNDGKFLYFSPLASRRLYRVPTSLLLVQPGPATPNAVNAAIAGTQFLGELSSHADGLETDADGLIYVSAPEHNAITIFQPETGISETLVKDPRIQWPDTLSVATNNRLYFTSNQYFLQPSLNNGTDLRVTPFGIFSVPIKAGKVQLV